MNESQYIGKGGDENNSQTDRRKEADKKTIDTFIAEFRRLLHFVLDPLDPDSHHDEDAGRKGRDRHHLHRRDRQGGPQVGEPLDHPRRVRRRRAAGAAEDP